MRDSGVKRGERVKDVRFTEDTLIVDLADGRTIIVPLATRDSCTVLRNSA